MSVNEMHGVIENPLNDETLQHMINLMEMGLNESLYEILKRIPVLRFLILGITKPAKKKEVKEEKAS